MKVIKRITSGYISESFEDRGHLHKGSPFKGLTKLKKKSTGKDATGRISSRYKGGASKRKYRMISDLNKFMDIEATVIRLEYDPNRTARIALIELKNGKKAYIIAPEALKAGDVLIASEKISIKSGNRAALKNIPVGSQVCDIELYPDSKSHMARSAGASATLMALESGYALLKLPSGELRKVHENCFATLGQISNSEHSNIKIGKAGRKRKMGIRPHVRGKAMNPDDHPHGGGEGVNPIGLKYPKTPWGKVAIGKKTRRNKRSNKFIVKRASKKR